MYRVAIAALAVVALTLTAARGQPQPVGEANVTIGSCSIVGSEFNLTMPDGLGSRLLRFLRVPYAEPPVGDRRFAKPQPFNFSRSDCRLTGEEAADPEKNLLRLSIRTPDLAPADPLPVLALLLDGSSDFNDSLGHEVGDAIGTSVVMATIGSRFGVLGNVPAGQNNGLEDQRLALEFLRDQLHRFGGDPARVTLAGHGAAAAAVGLHAVGSGGFSRVVMMSGSIAAPLGWSASAEVAAALDRQLAASLSCGIGDEGRLPLDCLRSKPLKDLLDAESLLRRDYGDGAGRFAPSFNASSLPDALWRSGAFNGSLMIGVGTGVGPALAELALRVQGADWGALDQTAFETILDREFGQFPRLHSAGRNASVSGRRYLRLTLSDWPHFAYGGRVRQILARALSDFGAVCPVWEAANDMIGSGRVFVYLHDEDGDPAAALSVANDAKVLLGEPLVRANYSAEHRSLSRIMMQHLVDFTASGAPSPGWPSSSAGAFDFLRFGAKTGVNSTSGGFAFEPGRCPLWSTEMSLASNLSASPPPPQPPPPPPPPPPRTSPGGAQPFSNTVLRNYSVNILGLGRTVGQTIRTPAGKVMTQFLGLPYAKPPIGGKRFAVPEPADAFGEDFLAISPKPACPQPGPLATSEDCLYLNLWTPKHSDREVEKLPVLVFLHGGFFQTGDAFDERWRGSHVLDQVDAVVVTVAYRLGALGFLWLQNASVPANLGLRDQALALQWVRYNVRFFDGSPSKISLVGAEAGAASVGFHLLAESLQFQRAVLLSGSPNSPFAVSPMPDEVRAMHKNFTASYLSCCQSAPAELLDCLRNLTSSEIVSAAADFQRDVARLQAPFVAFGPALDADFLKSDPWSVDALPPVPLLLGGVDSPGNTLVRLLLPDGLNVTRNRVLEHLGQSLRHFPRFGESLSSVGLEAASRRFAEFPSSTADAGVGDVKEAQLLSRALGDRHFTCPSWNFMARAAALSTAQVFGFLLAEPAEEIGDRLVGASLSDDAVYALGSPARPSKPLGEARAQLSGFLVRSLVEFANSGNVSWEAYGADSRRVLLLRDSGSGGWNVSWPPRYVEHALRGLDCAFWDQTLPCVASPDCINDLPTPSPTTPTETPTETPTAPQTATPQTEMTDSTGTQTPNPDAGGLETWAVALIVVFSVVGAGLLIGSGFLLYRCYFRSQSDGENFPMESNSGRANPPKRQAVQQPPPQQQYRQHEQPENYLRQSRPTEAGNSNGGYTG
ncbi:hypothetical protein BOX15_Mlig025559g3 [Macrostomum lignano]|uniref:Carboxylesterase type B domain-containing protein n=1 Tax=Macrostomum lignano TaxID=282301 RepID=A0A267FZZ8_9PLAT|nr:hypothetical protein BOX15_Mlig025559g3 [Macrostomum lignano]